jgi:hypothetical protein
VRRQQRPWTSIRPSTKALEATLTSNLLLSVGFLVQCWHEITAQERLFRKDLFSQRWYQRKALLSLPREDCQQRSEKSVTPLPVKDNENECSEKSVTPLPVKDNKNNCTNTFDDGSTLGSADGYNTVEELVGTAAASLQQAQLYQSTCPQQFSYSQMVEQCTEMCSLARQANQSKEVMGLVLEPYRVDLPPLQKLLKHWLSAVSLHSNLLLSPV